MSDNYMIDNKEDAYFAEISQDNIVLRVLVIPIDQKDRGEEFLSKDLGLGGRWIETSIDNSFRKQYAPIGSLYDEQNDVFISPKPYNSWVLDDNFDWIPPVPPPIEQGPVAWDEESLSWVSVPLILEDPII